MGYWLLIGYTMELSSVIDWDDPLRRPVCLWPLLGQSRGRAVQLYSVRLVLDSRMRALPQSHVHCLCPVRPPARRDGWES